MIRSILRSLVRYVVEPLSGYNRPGQDGIVALSISVGGLPAVTVRTTAPPKDISVGNGADKLFVYLSIKADQPLRPVVSYFGLRSTMLCFVLKEVK